MAAVVAALENKAGVSAAFVPTCSRTRRFGALRRTTTLALVGVMFPLHTPLAKASGHPLIGDLLFRIYTPLCHQLPERSFFVCGHQVGFCHRCAAMYSSIVAAGLLFGLLRRHIRPISLKIGGLLLLPILIDGLTHMADDLSGLGFRGGGDAIGTLNFWLRMITGALVGVVMLLAIYPRVERDLRSQFDGR